MNLEREFYETTPVEHSPRQPEIARDNPFDGRINSILIPLYAGIASTPPDNLRLALRTARQSDRGATSGLAVIQSEHENFAPVSLRHYLCGAAEVASSRAVSTGSNFRLG